jgi:nucleolar pre-ribosomal-associated protein 2
MKCGYSFVHKNMLLTNNFQALTFTPVLSKLKTLNESQTSIEDALEQAEEIAGLGSSTTKATQNARKSVSACKGHARAEWALRWLLERLKTREKTKETLLSPKAWNLLERLVQAIPIANAARLLNANHILSLIREALEELVQKLDTAVNTDAMTEKTPFVNSAGSDSSATLDHGSPSRKRKRTPVELKPQEKTSDAELSNFLLELNSFLTTLLNLSQPGSSRDIVSKEHMRSVLRTGTVEAAQLLALWLRCLNLVPTTSGFELTSSKNISREPLLFPIPRIWELRSLENDDNLGSSAATFSKVCLVPAIKLYHQITCGSKYRFFDSNLLRRNFCVVEVILLWPINTATFFTHSPIPHQATQLTIRHREHSAGQRPIQRLYGEIICQAFTGASTSFILYHQRC